MQGTPEPAHGEAGKPGPENALHRFHFPAAVFSSTAITVRCKRGGFNSRNLILGQKSEVKGQARLAPSEVVRDTPLGLLPRGPWVP